VKFGEDGSPFDLSDEVVYFVEGDNNLFPWRMSIVF